ncbi:MAG: hypothetical protein EOO90_24705 [Pedobacter sp.]|nr:MAG: hypothetical protein EOO90_24705 [Pedobacter sp.]
MALRNFYSFLILYFTFTNVNAQIVYPFGKSNLSDTSSNWLSTLGDRMTNAEIVGLGEVSHGDQESNLLKCRLVKYLVQEKGFKDIFIEYGDPALRKLNAFISDSAIKDTSALEALFDQTFINGGYHPPLYNNHFKELIKWLKTYNLENPAKMVSLRGIDINLGWNIFWNGWMNEGTKMRVRAEFGKKDLNLKETDAIISTWFKREEKTLRDSLGADQFSNLKMDVKNFLSNIRYLQNGDSRNAAMIDMRDSMMNENIKMLIKNKAIIWAHNLHVSNSGFSPSKQFNSKMLGNRLRESHANKYFIILTDYSEKANVNILSKANSFGTKSFASNNKTLAYELARKNRLEEGLVFSKDFSNADAVKFNNIGLLGDYFLIATTNVAYDALFYFKVLTPLNLYKNTRDN